MNWNFRYAHESMWKGVKFTPGMTHRQFGEEIGLHWIGYHGNSQEDVQNEYALIGLPVPREKLDEMWYTGLIHDDADQHGYACPVCKANMGGV